MSENEVMHTDVERILNDRDNIIVLHRLDGDIWGASIAATDIFGYSNEEMRQMCLVNIRPKALRLSDVCKDKMGTEALEVFQKRNTRRFSASVKRSVITFVYQREPIELVCLQLSLSSAHDTSAPKFHAMDVQEVTQFITSLKDESRTSLKNVSCSLDALVSTGLSEQQLQIVRQIKTDNEQLSHISENIVDSFRLAQNTLNLDSEPFNIIEFLSSNVLRLDSCDDRSRDLILSSRLPELVYGDKKMVEKVFRNLAGQVVAHLSPKASLLCVDYESSNERESRLFVKYLFEGCTLRSESPEERDFCGDFLNAMPIVFARHVLRLMDGTLRIDDLGDHRVELNLEVALPEVHDLGLTRKIDFLKGKAVILVDKPHAPLAVQLKAWGAQIDHFHSLPKAIEYMRSGRQPPALFIIHSDKEDAAAIDGLASSGLRLILIGRREALRSEKLAALALPPSASVPEIGNVLSQAVLEGFPYPYYNMSSKRSHLEASSQPQFMVVSHDVPLRAQLVDILRKMNMPVDEAVNGIDAVIASTNFCYDGIIIDDEIPYMDGVEAVIHLRRVSPVNRETPVLMVTADDSENAKLTRSQAGISAEILKPLNALHTQQMIKSLLMQERNAFDPDSLDDIGLPVSALRRSQELQEVPSYQANSTVIDEQVLDRLAQDTSIDVCKEMIDMFIGESLISLGEISKCCIAGDWDAILDHAHSLRSSCRTFGCEALYSTILQLEEESRKSNMGECMRLAATLPTLFLKSQQNLYDYCSFHNRT